jgi:FkbM family methyltransferase
MSLRRNITFLAQHEAFRHSPGKCAYRLLSWKAHCLLRTPATVSIPELGVRLFLPAVWRGSAKMIYVFRAAYERELPLLNRLLSAGQVFVDVGANYGVYTAAASQAVGPTGRVLSFEPATDAFAVLERNIRLGNVGNVAAFRMALSKDRQPMVLRLREDSSTNAIGAAPAEGEPFEPIVTSTLDAELARAGVDHVHLLKLDVEGAEEWVLRGAPEVLQRSKPSLLFEVNAEAAEMLGLHPQGAWHLLLDHGYRFFQLDDGHRMAERHTCPAGGNVVAIHRSREALVDPLSSGGTTRRASAV